MITRKIVMIKEEEQVSTFLLENDTIVEIHCAAQVAGKKTCHRLGNIYIGKVKNIVPNIGAAFIEVESGVECYYDLTQAENALFTSKTGKKSLCIGDELVVQISKEAVKTKAPTVSSNLSFTGRYAVLTTGNTRIGTSGKLPKAQKQYYKELLLPFQNDEYGLIIRTNAKDASFESVIDEIHSLQDTYRELKRISATRTCFSCLLQAPPAYITDLKNVYTEGLTEIIIEDPDLFHQVEKYFITEQPEDLDKLRLYQDDLLPLSRLYSTQTALDNALGEKVWLKSGGYLVIQYTEALTVIDVNSGKCGTKKKAADTYLKINLEAAMETARQMRLRNLSGIIIVDFINLDNEADEQVLLKELRQALLADPIQTSLVDVTALQLVELTRKKVRKPLYECVKRQIGKDRN